MKELYFQITMLSIFVVSLLSSFFKNELLFLASLAALVSFAFYYKRKAYIIFSLFLVLFSALIFYVSTLQSYETFLFFTPLLLFSFILLFILIIIYRFLFPQSIEGKVLSYDPKTSYAIVEMPFDFFLGIQPGEYIVRSKKKLKVGDKLKVKLKASLFSPPKMVADE